METSCFVKLKLCWKRLLRDRTYLLKENQNSSKKNNFRKNSNSRRSNPGIQYIEANKNNSDPDEHFKNFRPCKNLQLHHEFNILPELSFNGPESSDRNLSTGIPSVHPLSPMKESQFDSTLPVFKKTNKSNLTSQNRITNDFEAPDQLINNEKQIPIQRKSSENINDEILISEPFSPEVNQVVHSHSIELTTGSNNSKFQESDELFMPILGGNFDNKCFSCREQFNIVEEGIIASCRDCKLCMICLAKLFRQVINNDRNAPFSCKCGLPINYSLFMSSVPITDLKIYLEKLNRYDYEPPLIFACKCNYKVKNEEKGTKTFICIKCIKTYCLRCFEPHDESLTCLKYFKNNQRCSKDEVIELKCGCKISEKLQLDFFNQYSQENHFKFPVCPKCNLKLSRSDERLLSEHEKGLNQSLEFQCPICYERKKINDSQTLDCDHLSCRHCLISYLKTYLDNNFLLLGQIPCYVCYQAINPQTIENLLEGNYKLRYLKNRRCGTLSNKVLKICNHCDYKSYITIGRDRFDCTKCNKSICAKCNKPYHKNCCENLLSYETLPKEMRGQVVNCPNCGIRIMKDNGCNFIKCGMPDCGNIFFCFLCKKILRVKGI